MSPTDEMVQEEIPVESTRIATPPQDAMADETTREDVMEKEMEADNLPTDDLATQTDPPRPASVSEGGVGGEATPKEPDANLSTATGKRPMGDAAEDEGEEQDDQVEPPRKKVRRSRRKGRKAAQDDPAWEPLDGVDDEEVGSDGASKKTTSISSDDQETAPYPDEPLVSDASVPGLRTSFGASAQTLTQTTNPDMLVHNPLTTEQRKELTDVIRAAESVSLPPMMKRELLWAVTPIKAEWLVGATWLEIFESVVDQWCVAFKAENQKNIEEIGLAPSFLKLAFTKRLEMKMLPGDVCAGLRRIANRQLKHADTSRLRNFAGQFKPNEQKIAKRAAKNEARLAAQRQKAISDVESKPAATNNPSQPINADVDVKLDESNPTSASGQAQDSKSDKEEGEVDSDNAITNTAAVETNTHEHEPGPSVTQAELDQRHLYYPGVQDTATFCLTCAQYGHTTDHCPEATCKHCQGIHFNYECPTRQRCGKCKQIGHTKSTCPEKLAVAQGETAIECAVCEFHDHTETNCSELWQTYRPRPGNVKKVRSLPVFCYRCGAEGHFGGDCGLADPSVPPTKTWTIATASLYIDPASNEDALVYKNYSPPAAPPGAPVIPGRSIVPRSHIFFESDDSDGGDFLHAPSNRQQQQRGGSKIQIKSNMTFGASATGGPSSSYTDKQPRNQPKPGGSEASSGTRANKSGGGRGSRGGSKGGNSRAKKDRQQASSPPSFIPLQGGGSGGSGGGRGGGGGGGGARGRGGFSSLKKRRGRSQSKGQGRS